MTEAIATGGTPDMRQRIIRSISYLRLEMALGGTMAAAAIMAPFYNSIGLTQGQLGLTQALFTIAFLLFNQPVGWIADQRSRRICNMIGDALIAVGFIGYAFSDSFTGVLTAEIVLAFGAIFTDGSDKGLLKYYAQIAQPDDAEEAHKIVEDVTVQAQLLLHLFQSVALGVAAGVVFLTDLRFAFVVGAVPFVIGILLSLAMYKDVRHDEVENNEKRDDDQCSLSKRLLKLPGSWWRDAKLALSVINKNKRLRWMIGADAVSIRLMTPLNVALTPILMLAGVPLEWVFIGFILNALLKAFGAYAFGALIKRRAKKGKVISSFSRFLIPATITMVAIGVMSVSLNEVTMWFYGALGLAQGWAAAAMSPLIQKEVPEKMQSNVLSFVGNAKELLYVPLVVIINWAGNEGIEGSIQASFWIGLALVAVVISWRFLDRVR